TVYEVDLQVGQGDARVERGDRRVVPAGDLAQVDVAEQGTGDAQLAGLEAFQVDHRHHAADGRGELAEAGFGQLLARQRRVGRTEIDRAGLDLGDAAAGADRLVVDLVTGRLVVVGRPLGDQRIDE